MPQPVTPLNRILENQIYVVKSGYALPRFYHPDFHDLEKVNEGIYYFNKFKDQIHVTHDFGYALSLANVLIRSGLQNVHVVDSVNRAETSLIRDSMKRQIIELSKGGILSRMIAGRLIKDLELYMEAIMIHDEAVAEIEAEALVSGGAESPMIYKTEGGSKVVFVI